ncbi:MULTISPECIES: hypothetical protein [Sphingobacterium]|uniref:hypothetical protein n=1 Tax=Sphingobacterium TaxID=28453 RepID=UPI000DFAC9FB|nr:MULTISPECIES: hypothetical protein [Sphingobacterium]QQT43555.1 hypothetical protein I6J00_17615 [Sphingobacterium multivorum]SUI97947.1 Alg9-like mannosyltransferase family [Sphingobacterium multivorum]
MKVSILLIIAAIVYIISAWYNIGYYHADEHYQLIEFSGLKLGWNNKNNLAWEFHSMIRPSFQVWVCYLLFGFFNILGISDPYILSFILRLVTAFLAIVGIYVFYKRSKYMLPLNNHFVYACLSFFIWFIPFVSVRFSSETWSGILFMFGLSFLLTQNGYKRRNFYLAGLFIGLSFLCRFQTGIMVIGIIAWLIVIRKYSLTKLAEVIIPIFIVIQIGLALDFLFYGECVVTFWNYFKVNILDDVSSNYGVSPWWTIPAYLVEQPLVPIGSLIVLSYIVICIGYPKSPIVWCTLPFILIHSLIPHKELRFLFPLVWFVPFTVMLAFSRLMMLKRLISDKYLSAVKFIGVVAAIVLLILNSVALSYAISTPVGYRQKWLTKKIRDDFQGGPVKIIHTSSGNPFEPWPILEENFYKEKNISYQRIEHWRDIEKYICIRSDTIYLLAMRRFDNLTSSSLKMDSLKTKELFTTEPGIAINTFGLSEDLNTNYFIIHSITKKNE